MFTAYFDESRSDGASPVVVMAGYVGADEQWHRFRDDWARLLERYGLTHCHMVDFAHSRGEFAGWDERTRRGLVCQATTLINLRTSFGFAASVVEADYDAMKAANPAEESHYKFVSAVCLSLILGAKEFSAIEGLAYVFEDGAAHKGEIDRDLGRVRDDAQLAKDYKLFDFAFKEKKDPQHTPLQAADMLAYETQKWLRDKARPMRMPLQLLLKNDRVRSAFHDKSSLPTLREKLTEHDRRVAAIHTIRRVGR